jgi:hypothetical protein
MDKARPGILVSGGVRQRELIGWSKMGGKRKVKMWRCGLGMMGVTMQEEYRNTLRDRWDWIGDGWYDGGLCEDTLCCGKGVNVNVSIQSVKDD